MVNNQSCILLSNQQDSRNHVHSLALVPAVKKDRGGGDSDISFPNAELHWLRPVETGLFPICFQMQTQHGYLVLAIVPHGVIPDPTNHGHFQTPGAPTLTATIEDVKRDQQMVREWIATHIEWVRTNGIVIHA